MSTRAWTGPLLGLAGLALTAAACGDSSGSAEARAPESGAPAAAHRESASTPSSPPPFSLHGEDLGLDFVHFNGMSGELYFCETFGSGCALLDHDGDGDLDAYFVQGHMLGDGDPSTATFPPEPGRSLVDRLFQNLLVEEGELGFRDVTEAAELHADGYGMGVTTGDCDNDGDVDIYLTNFGPNQLWSNDGDGTFTDVTARAGVDDDGFSTCATFVDTDRDGWLDLFVGNYVRFTLATNKECWARSTVRDYCGPSSYKPQPDRLFHNTGGGRFEDVTAAAGLSLEFGSALGALACDVNGDGWQDLYVCNDGVDNQLWINAGDGTFRNEALLAGCAFNGQGEAEASMGVDAADFDGDGDDDLFMTHMDNETNTLFVGDGAGQFVDGTNLASLAAPSRSYTGFGTGWIDYDNDGLLDLVAVNGAVLLLADQLAAGEPYPLLQTNQLFRNVGGGRLVEVTDTAGPAFAPAEVSRGAALGDVDDDGDVDVLVSNNSGPARLLVNEVGSRAGWVGLRLLSAEGRDGLGARVAVTLDDDSVLWRRVRTDGSYASARDPRVLVGLGDRDVTRVTVHWAGGRRESWDWSAREARRYHTLEEGSGDAVR